MSEPQTEYETEHEIDAEPGFASAPWEPERPDESGHAHVWGSDGDLVATVCGNPVYGETAFDRARLIAFASHLKVLLGEAYDELYKIDHLTDADVPQDLMARIQDALASAEDSGDE